MTCVNLDQSHLAVLDGLMHEVLLEIDVLDSLSSSDHEISPLDACGAVLIDRGVWEPHVLEEVAEVDYIDGYLRCCVIFCLCC